MSIELGNLVTYNPLTVHVEDTLESILDMTSGLPFHHWPVVDDDRRLVGILAEQDLTAAFTRRLAVAGHETENAAPGAQPVSQVMSREVITVSENTPVDEALLIMLRRGIHCLPVVAEQRLVAILASTDLLREFSFGELKACRETVNDHLLNCVDFLTSEVTLAETEAMLDAEQVDCLPVMQGDCPLGLVTRRQLRRTLLRQVVEQMHATEENPARMLDSVRECLLPIEPLRPGQKLSSAATAMVEHGAQALPVVNQAKRFLGVITEEQILRLMLAELVQA